MDNHQVYQWLDEVTDPEVPVLTVNDLGIIRDVAILTNDQEPAVIVTITPTYSGCPAMDVISTNIRMVLRSHGIKNITIRNRLSPAWTTDWMTAEGKRKLTEYGIAAPQYQVKDANILFETIKVPCPRCLSTHTEMVSQFGATSCKSLYKCLDCLEPFEYFKCH